MGDSDRILNLDEVQSVAIIFGGREFKITQQRRAALEKVLRIAHEENKEAVEGDEQRPLSERLFENWDAALPAFAIILGHEEGSPEHERVIDLLRENLTVPAALQIYETWWDLNQVDNFFVRGGRPLLPKYIVKALQEQPPG